MDVQLDDIARRLTSELARGDRLLFWEDESGEYRSALTEVSTLGAKILDATQAELATKRAVYRDCL